MLTKDLINNIAETTGLTKKRVEELLNATNAAVRDALLEGACKRNVPNPLIFT